MLLNINREPFIFNKSANIFLEALAFVSSLSIESLNVSISSFNG